MVVHLNTDLSGRSKTKLEFEDFGKNVKEILNNQTSRFVFPQYPHLTPAAVILPILNTDRGIEVLFTRRTNLVRSHRGQVSFPGGAYCATDKDLVETAVRETEEEIGVPASRIEILGKLPALPTVSTGYLVYPLVAILPYPFRFRRNRREVEEIFTVPIDFLASEQNWRLDQVETDDGMFTTFFCRYKGYLIWGMTARLLRKFIMILRKSSLI